MVFAGRKGGDWANMLQVMSMFKGKGWGKGKGRGGNDKTFNKLRTVDAERKVWVGGLPKGLTWKDLEKHFEETCGTKPSISEVMANGTGVCAFKTAEDALMAIGSVNGSELKGKNIEVDVWTKKEKGEGGGGGKWKLVERLKELQRSDADAKAKWWAFTDESHGGIHDPKKHDVAVLEEFLTAYPEKEGAGGDEKWKLVQKIKDLQRSDDDAKAKWWAFTDKSHGGIHDPKKHDKAVLEEFLAAHA